MKNMINKRVFAVLMAIAVFFTCSPALSYAFTEMPENIEKAAEAEETAEDIATLEAEEENAAIPETETEDPDSQPEAAGISAVEPDAAYQDASADIDDLLSGLEAAEDNEDQGDLITFESKAAQSDAGDANVVKAEDIRVFGSTRFDTAIKVADMYKSTSGSKFKNVIVAYGKNFPDALSGGYLAKVKEAPILLVDPSEETRVVNYISENIVSGGRVYILGGTGVVSSAFESKVKAKGISTQRLGGATRYETNLAILKAAGVKAEDILVCTASGYADSLSASAVGKPILLVGNTLTADQKNYLKGLKKAYLIGGEGVVKPAIQTGLEALGLNTERLAGSTRYETSAAVAEKFFAKTKTVMLVYALNFPDGLSGGPLAMQESAPIILTDSTNITAAREYVKSSGAFRSITLGGPTLISDEAVIKIMGRTEPYVNVDKINANINVGETVVITAKSNYGTKYSVKNSKNIELVSEETTYNEKGEPIDRITIKGKTNGATVLVFKDDYKGSYYPPGLATKTVVINVGELSVENLYDIIDMTGYINRAEAQSKGTDRTVELSKSTDKTRVFLVNHTENGSKEVELVCAVQNGSANTYTSVMLPLNPSTACPVYTVIGEGEDEFETDVNPGEYTTSTKIHTNDSVNAAFKSSMATWNSVLKSNYGMVMKNIGFTKY